MSQLPVGSVEVCNLALDRLGSPAITSVLVPDSPLADVCARWYDQTRRQILRKFIFNFARKTDSLTANPDAPTHPEFVNGYSIPVDFVRLLTIGDRILYGGNIPTQFFDFSAGFLYCDDLTNQGTGIVTDAATLGITAIYRSGETISGVTVPTGYTVVVPSGDVPIPGAVYLVSAVVGATQANGNSFQMVAGTLSSLSVFFLQTSGGQNFDSSTWGVYVSGGIATPTFVPPGSLSNAQALEIGYIYDATDVRKFDPLFIDVLRLQMAVNMCRAITKKEPDDKLRSELENANLAAAAIAGQEKAPRRVQRSRIRDVRRAGGIFRNSTRIGTFGGF